MIGKTIKSIIGDATTPTYLYMTDESVYEAVITQDQYEDNWERVEFKETPKEKIEPEHQLDLGIINEEEYDRIIIENNKRYEDEEKQKALDKVRFYNVTSTLSSEDVKLLRNYKHLL